MTNTDQAPITELLQSWKTGDADSRGDLFAAVYQELRRLAAIQMRGERGNHTLQPTALVNECYAKLINVNLEWKDRAHFLNFCVRAMRRLLVDHARAKVSEKRGGKDAVQVTLDPAISGASQSLEELLELDRAFEELAAVSDRSSRAIQMQAYAGLNHREIGSVLGVSDATVDRDLRFARAWLKDRLGKD